MIKWGGGPCPVSSATWVETNTRCGFTGMISTAHGCQWEHSTTSPELDIVEYRVLGCMPDFPQDHDVLAVLHDVSRCLEAWDLYDRDIYRDVLSMMNRIKAAKW